MTNRILTSRSGYARSTIGALALFAGGVIACPPVNNDAATQGGDAPVLQCGVGLVQEQPASIDVVFVLDTTGSMGGLIEGAKQKIWAIANEIAQAQPAPIVRMGLVGYRDRGDQYVTKMTELTDDIDTVYADLMAYQAVGGGDTPESVNEALFQAVERFDWTTSEKSLKLVYLVGDAPPKMEYEDDVKYLATCRLAYERGININTIQCGRMNETRKIWQEIAQNASGAFAAIEQNGGVVAIETPYDEQMADLDGQLSKTMLDYGDREVYAAQLRKRDLSEKITAESASGAAADRAVYNLSDAGRRNAYGAQELVDDVANNRVELKDVKKEHLPEAMQAMSLSELGEEINKRLAERKEISAQIRELAEKRSAYIAEHMPESSKDGFDQKVLDALIEQGARVGINFAGKKD